LAAGTMAQIKVFGLKSELDPIKSRLSHAIHACVVEALSLPYDKRFHRFFPMDEGNFVFPADRSQRYTIIEISVFEGRSVATKKQLIELLFARLRQDLDLAPNDIEITIAETPRCNWGIRGLPGDELDLNYTVTV
jgi:phenylpyruvate tautomerase PptA (4-oxalocrotonate tautomerase family)